MITPVLLYSSTGTPMGAQGYVAAKIQFYRPTAALDAAGLDYVASVGPAFGSESGGVAVGSPIIVSKVGLSFSAKVTRTEGRYGQSNNDPTVLRGDPELNLSTFILGAGQATLMIGDYCNLIIGWIPSSTVAAPVPTAASRWLIEGNSLNTGGANEWNMKLGFDRPNSSPSFNLF